jgi:hypothetical protein
VVRIARREPHAVRVQRELLAAMEDQRLGGIEIDLVLAEQLDPARLGDRGDPLRDAIDVDGLRVLALEPEHHRFVAAVPLAREAEATEQLDLHARGLRELTIRLEALGESLRGAHRSDRVRARRPDPDLEDVEDADVHASLSVLPKTKSAS